MLVSDLLLIFVCIVKLVVSEQLKIIKCCEFESHLMYF